MRIHELYPWLPMLTAAFTFIAMTVRCLTLLTGLVVVLRNAHSSDRPEIFREFARAVSFRRYITKSAVEEPRSRAMPEGLPRAALTCMCQSDTTAE